MIRLWDNAWNEFIPFLDCPAAVTRPITAAGNVTFGAACRGCALRTRCTASRDGRSLNLWPHDGLQRMVRQQSRNLDWLNEYRQHRPMVERTIDWLTRGDRKVRYRGVTRTDH